MAHEGVERPRDPGDVALYGPRTLVFLDRAADTGVLDAFFESYLAFAARQPISFAEWLDHHYDPAELKRSFRSNRWADRLVNGVLRRE